jgi:hypothetical protein
MSTGVIVARFQTYRLHSGHMHLIDEVIKKCKKLVIVLWEKSTPDENNILPVWIRSGMLMEFFMKNYGRDLDYIIHQMTSTVNMKPSDHLDDILKIYNDITLYGSRDSFLSIYEGKHKCELIPEFSGVSGTQQRESMTITNTEDFRKGILYGFKLTKKSEK